jgi:hypothetical protein
MRKSSGRTVPLSLPRRLVGDLVYFAHKVPTVPVQRLMDLAAVVEAREAAEPRPSWCAVFLKAYAIVAARRPELRRAYLSFPRPRLYEHGRNIASIAVERRYGDENAVFFGHIRSPEDHPLGEIDVYLRRLKEDPVESIGLCRQALRISRLPWPLRRLLWWVGLNVSGYQRTRRMGTFGITVYSSLGAESLHPLSPLTTTLNYGVIGDDGRVPVRIVYDHRVLDGAVVARVLGSLEDVLNGEILNELRELESPEAVEGLHAVREQRSTAEGAAPRLRSAARQLRGTCLRPSA